MKRKINFDPAWIMLSLVVITLVVMNFMDDQHSRNLLAGIVLASCFLLFAVSVLTNSFNNNAHNERM